MTANALKVRNLLQTIEKQQPRSDKTELTARVTETELDAYIVWRLAEEEDTLIRSLKVHLLGDNNISGKLRLDDEKIALGALLGDDLDFDFKGVLETRNGAARLAMTALQVGGRSISPQALDLVISSAAAYQGRKAKSISDWYALPKGIKRITVLKGVAVLHY